MSNFNKKDRNIIRQEYQEQLIKLKEICKELKQAPHYLKLSQEYKLRSSRWFIDHCENPKVKDYNSFMEFEVGIKPNYLLSKDTVTNLIYNFCKENNGNINQNDVMKHLNFSPTVIGRIWGGFRNMRRDLGLENVSVGGNDRSKSIDEILNYLDIFFKYLKINKTIAFTTTDVDEFFKENNIEITFNTVQNRLKKANLKAVRELAKENNLDLAQEGRGLVTIFSDGEKALSRYEKLFSTILRNSGFVYNKTYFRDVKYSDIFNEIEKCRNPMTIDYLLIYKGRKIYIELAGVLRDYEKSFKENKTITSESKNKYRIQLMKKEEILKRNNVEYYIVIPRTKRTLEYIISKMNLYFIKGDK